MWQLDTRGWALPDLGGITHQTVAGFLSTGSRGGTLQHDLGAAIVGIRLIDGTGQVHDLAPNPDDPEDEERNPFYAAGVSMGLLGIVSTVTLECGPRYDVQGLHSTMPAQDCHSNLFTSGKEGLEGFFQDKKNQYTRLFWWPQQGGDIRRCRWTTTSRTSTCQRSSPSCSRTRWPVSTTFARNTPCGGSSWRSGGRWSRMASS